MLHLKVLTFGAIRGTIAFLLVAQMMLAARGADPAPQSPRGKTPQRTRRVLYNFDGDSCLTTKAGGKGPVPVNADDVKRLIEEVAYEGSRVDTVLVCINAQVMYYPTKVGTMRGTLSTADEREKWPASEKQRFQNLQAFFGQGVDPYAIMLAEAKTARPRSMAHVSHERRSRQRFFANEVSGRSSGVAAGDRTISRQRSAGLWTRRVRDYTFRLIDEAVRRYACDGIELDFNRSRRSSKTARPRNAWRR